MEDKKADIFICGKEIFSSKGFKDTNVSDITKMVGIGVGTFYNYYSSKEKLFIEIYLKENEGLKRKIMETVDTDDDPAKVLKEVMAINFNGMNSNPILKEWYNRDLFSKLEKEFYEQDGFKSIDEFMNSGTVELIKKWKAEGRIRNDLDDDMILAIFNSIPYIDIHKSEIGIQYFPQILEYIVEFIMKGLSNCQK
nr:TetR/AcrR family transcriptional regulator [uncultured Caproiciproducens sp.]